MNVIKKYKERVGKYGRSYVWGIIIRNKVMIPLNILTLKLGRMIFSNAHLRNTIVIESHNDFDCNGGTIYDYLVAHDYNSRYKIVWLLKNRVKNRLPHNVYTFNIWKPSLRKTWAIATARFLFSDDVITEKMKEDQISVYCTHGGCTFKNVKGKIIVPEHVDYILSASKNYDPLMCENYSIPFPNKRMLHFGFPSNDVFFEKTEHEIKKITERKYKKVVLWMPTFRKTKADFNRNDSINEQPLGIPLFSKNEELKDLNEILEEYQCLLVIKIHPMQDPLTYADLKSFSNIIVLDANTTKEYGVDNYRLMKDSDALISDYSSATYSYLLLNRPVGFVLEDINAYKVGLLVPNYKDYMPGSIINCRDEFVSFIKQICMGKDDFRLEREKLLDWLYENKSGKSTEQIINYLGI